jgi:hypothetical protein
VAARQRAEIDTELKNSLIKRRRYNPLQYQTRLIVADSGYRWCLTRHLQGFHPDSGDPGIYPLLFGFDRTRAISSEPASQIAKAAELFGQEDDITVLSVSRTAGLNPALA